MSVQFLTLLVMLGANLAAIAFGWGDMRRLVADNKERQDERHEENQRVLNQIRDDVKRINGNVQRHDALLLDHHDEIRRLRDKL